jgi:hypothetical protein
VKSDHPGEAGKAIIPDPSKPEAIVGDNVKIAGEVKASEVLGNAVIAGDANAVTIIVPAEIRMGDKFSNITGSNIGSRTNLSAGRENVINRSGIQVSGEGIKAERLAVGRGATAKEIISSEQALGRIADAVRLNLGQLQLNMEQARRESSQFFRTTMIFSGVAFAIILGGVAMMLGGLVTVGIVTTAASVVPQAGALLLFNKDKELRRTIETYHGHILESQRVLTMIDLAETMGQATAKDAIKEQIILTVLKVKPVKTS